MYDFDDIDGQYEQDTYAGDRWGAWLDDTRPAFTPPHTAHPDAIYSRQDWLDWAAESEGNDYSFAEWTEMQATSDCEECTDYHDSWAAELAERRAGC